jgi:hypothetical protein
MRFWNKILKLSLFNKKKSLGSDNQAQKSVTILHTPQEYINQHVLSVLIHVSKYYFLIINCLLKDENIKISDICLNQKDFFVKQEDKWKLLEKATNNKDRNVAKIIMYFQKLEELMGSILTTTENFLSKGKDVDDDLHSSYIALLEYFTEYINFAVHGLHSSKKSTLKEISEKSDGLLQYIEKLKKKIIKQTRKNEITIPASLYYLKFLSDTETIIILLQRIMLRVLN